MMVEGAGPLPAPTITESNLALKPLCLCCHVMRPSARKGW
jgi:hypothetical protein